MPLSLAFRFLAGRYHATPFGHHVNEGLIEWPPSPWRLLRALLSIGYTSGAWNAGPPPVARCLIEKLSAEPPRYFLPPAIGAHSRHYMPIGVLEGKTKVEKTTLVFDTWARVEDRELVATWHNVHLNDTELSILRVLVERLNYLGRSESWVEGRVMGNGEPTPEPNCFPEHRGETPSRDWEQVALLAPTSTSDFEAWRAAQLEGALADLSLPEGGKPGKTLLDKRARAAAPYPADLLDCWTAGLLAEGYDVVALPRVEPAAWKPASLLLEAVRCGLGRRAEVENCGPLRETGRSHAPVPHECQPQRPCAAAGDQNLAASGIAASRAHRHRVPERGATTRTYRARRQPPTASGAA